MTARTQTKERITLSPRLVLGLGSIMSWSFIAFFSRLVHYSERYTLSHLNTAYAWASVGMIFALVGCALFCKPLFHHAANTTGKTVDEIAPNLSRLMAIVSACSVTLATIVLVMVEERYFTQPWCSIAAFVSGAGSGVLFLCWAPHFIQRKRADAFFSLIHTFFFSAALFAIMLHLPKQIALALTGTLPLFSLFLFFTEEQQSGSYPFGTTKSIKAIRHVYARVLATGAALGFAESLIRSLFLVIDPINNSDAYRWLFFAATIIAGLTIGTSKIFDTNSNTIHNMNRMATFGMCLLFLLCPIVSGLGLWAELPPLICYNLFYMLAWVYLTQTARAYDVVPRRLFGLGLGMAYTGGLAGTLLGGYLTSVYTLGYRIESLIALVCAGLVLLAFLFVADTKTFALVLDADDERPQTPRRFRLRVEEVAQTYGLTAKETEVLLLVAKGRTTQRIREELGISTGTANTHLMHIYKKLDVHDRQSLLDMLEGPQEE